MTTLELIEELRKRKIDFYLVGDNLKVEGTRGTLVPELIDVVREHKSELVAYLSNRSRNDDQAEWRKYTQWAWTGILLEAERQGDTERTNFAQEVLDSIGHVRKEVHHGPA